MGIEETFGCQFSPARRKDESHRLPPRYSPPKWERPQAELPLPVYNPPADDGRPKSKKGGYVSILDIGSGADLVPDANDCGPNVFSMC